MAALLGAEFVPAPRVKPGRGLNGWIALFILLLIFLAFPVVADDSSPAPPAVPALPEQPSDCLVQLAPYGIVTLIALEPAQETGQFPFARRPIPLNTEVPYGKH